MSELCQSCGADDDVIRVVRLYVHHEPGDRPSDDHQPVADDGDEELWCFVCRTHYAHREVDVSS